MKKFSILLLSMFFSICFMSCTVSAAYLEIRKVSFSNLEIFDIIESNITLTSEELREYNDNSHYNIFGYESGASSNLISMQTSENHYNFCTSTSRFMGIKYPEWINTYYHDLTNNILYEFTDFFVSHMVSDGTAILTKYEQRGENYGKPTFDFTLHKVKIKAPKAITVFLDNEKISFPQNPIIDNGRTLVPLRKIFEALDANVEWDGETSTVTATKGDTIIVLVIGNNVAQKNGVNVNIDVPAKIVNGSTMVPVRFISDCFGVDVDWDGALQKVILTSK